MTLARKGAPVSGRRFPGGTAQALTMFASTRARRLAQIWLASATVIIIAVTAFLWLPQAPTVNAAPEGEAPLDCLSCHTRVLKGHDKLGSGSEACWVCHDSITIGKLRLLDGTQVSLEDSPAVCSQCHPDQYRAWDYGTHGVPASRVGEAATPGVEKPKCVGCHNPHQPLMELAAVSEYPLPPTGEGGPLDCLSCHVRVLKAHDELGSGSKACWACHYNMEMGLLHLASGDVRLPLTDFPQLCAQCHQNRYQAWVEGTHGAPAWKEGDVEVHGAQQVGCIGCHDPHQPQVVFSNITEPHPPAQPSPSPPSVFLFVLLGASVLLAIAVGVALVRKGEGP